MWTLLGLAADLGRDNDWFRCTLGGRSVFVQRFGDEIAGFENVCPHRFYPLRTSDRGNGPIICGFHHWHYDRRGHVVGIPVCKDILGVTPREVPARLQRIEVATCGQFIFGRFAEAGNGQDLKHFLADGAGILASIAGASPRVNRLNQIVDADWRLMMNVTLDDYHNGPVHNRTMLPVNSDHHYWRFGSHSALVKGDDPTLASTVERWRSGHYRPNDYTILNFFPNLVISFTKARPYWNAHIQQFVPLSPHRSLWRNWYFTTTHPVADDTLLHRLTRPLTDRVRARVARYYIVKIGGEDHRVCELQQQVAHQSGARPILGALERRVGWFNEECARLFDGPGGGTS